MYLFAAVLYTTQGTMPVDASEKSDVSQEVRVVLEAKEERKTKGEACSSWIAGSEPELMDKVKGILQDLQDEPNF